MELYIVKKVKKVAKKQQHLGTFIETASVQGETKEKPTAWFNLLLYHYHHHWIICDLILPEIIVLKILTLWFDKSLVIVKIKTILHGRCLLNLLV